MSLSKTPKRASRKNFFPVLLNHRLDQKLVGYASAASAAGVGLLALAQTAQAKIIYVPTQQTIPPRGSVALDLNNDGVTDFVIHSNYGSCFTGPDCEFQELSLSPVGRNRVLATYGGMGFAQALPANKRIGPAEYFRNRFGYAKMDRCKATRTSYYASGSWPGAKDLYLGLQFLIEGKIHYGWARLSLKVSGRNCSATAVLSGYAYETVPDKEIGSGRTGAPDEASAAQRPDVMLGALALGSMGLVARRRDEDAELMGKAVDSNP